MSAHASVVAALLAVAFTLSGARSVRADLGPPRFHVERTPAVSPSVHRLPLCGPDEIRVGHACVKRDAGSPADAGAPSDVGITSDGGALSDASVPAIIDVPHGTLFFDAGVVNEPNVKAAGCASGAACACETVPSREERLPLLLAPLGLVAVLALRRGGRFPTS